ncbi:hypothetical protein SO802_029205 [Lithocarpus litseifolius]|uniref:Ty3 transposon capsid-like protein domain-containing protein n=1 Tax=Lithocarpus litseifolius TaxID=425828 RepID=A0AAW2BSK1_9ROSI
MEMISRRLEALDNNFRGLQAVCEDTLPTVQQRDGPQEGPAPQLENHPKAEVLPHHPHPRPEIGALIPKPIRLEFPRFSGERILNASYHLDDEALIWFQDCERSLDSWETFVRAIQVRFGPSLYDDPLETLTKLKQTTTVVAYKSQFEMLSNGIRNLPESHKLSCFLSRLGDEIRLAMRMQNPRTLSIAFSLAKIQEEYLFTCKKVYRPFHESSKINW